MTARILVVDDDPVVLSTYRLSLEEHELSRKNGSALSEIEKCLFEDHGAEAPIAENWRVDYCDQGLDAVAAVKDAVDNRDPYSLVFLDVRMPPGIDGYETAIAIRQIDSDVHIAFVSAYADYSLEDLIEAGGPHDSVNFMQKPVWPDVLRRFARYKCDDAEDRRRNSLRNRARG